MISVMILRTSQHISVIFRFPNLVLIRFTIYGKPKNFDVCNMTVECGLEMRVIDQIMEKIETNYQRIIGEYPCLFVIKTSIRWKLHTKWSNLRSGNIISLSVSEIRNYHYYILISSKCPALFLSTITYWSLQLPAFFRWVQYLVMFFCILNKTLYLNKRDWLFSFLCLCQRLPHNLNFHSSLLFQTLFPEKAKLNKETEMELQCIIYYK